MAAPRVPNAGIGPKPLMSTTLKITFKPVIKMPSRIGVLASPAARTAPLNIKKLNMPKLNTNMMRI